MAVYNGYRPQKSIDLYVTTGTTSDYAYGALGSIGYTFEHAGSSFHPPYAETIAEYDGSAPAAGAGKGGNREAYFKALENTAASARHATLTGKAPPGTVLLGGRDVLVGDTLVRFEPGGPEGRPELVAEVLL